MISAKPFDFPYDGSPLPSVTALVVIDLQQDFLSATGYLPAADTTRRRCGRSFRLSTV
jgi:hypothetical protein